MNFNKQSITALIFSWSHVNDGKINSIRVALIHGLSLRKIRQNIKKIKKRDFMS
jgi:hypothetical protein